MTNQGRSVVVTGLGCISASGHNAQEFWNAVKAGQTGIGPSEYPFRSELNGAPIAEVHHYDPLKYFDKKTLRMLDLGSQFALIAAKEAIQSSQLNISPDTSNRIGIVLGSSSMGMQTTDEVLEQYYRHNKAVPPLTIPKGFQCAAASQISIRHGITGPNWMVNTACASSNHAIGQAFELIKCGQSDVVLTGGTDAPITIPIFQAWSALRILDPVTCRPFSKDRQGLILAEGAGILVLEEEQHALKRGAHIFARLAGYGFSSDADDLIRMSPSGASRAIRLAMNNAGLKPEDIDYINAHGTGTQVNDQTETEIIKDIFGSHAKQLLVSSSKSMHGHILGASGALELIATIKALEEQCIPPTANFSEADEKLDLDFVPNNARHKKIKAALSNSFAFGGLNAVLATTHYS